MHHVGDGLVSQVSRGQKCQEEEGQSHVAVTCGSPPDISQGPRGC